MAAPYTPMDLTGTGYAWNPTPVRYHGNPLYPTYPGRLALAGYDTAPEDCTETENRWLLNGTLLVCTGCGADGT